jgi:DNA polymerase-3 subunit delta
MGSLPDSEISSIYYFYGEEEFLMNQEVNRIRSAILKGNNSNFHILYGKESNVNEVINLARSIPLMGGNRVVIVKEADNLKGIDSEKFISYIKKPVKSTSVIFIAKKADFRKRYIQVLKNLNLLREFNLLKYSDLKSWVLKEVKRYDKMISEDAVNTLIDILGNNLYILHNEIAKLVNFVGYRKKIKLEDVREIISDIGNETIFDLLNSIVRKERNRSIYLINRLINNGIPPLLILNMIIRHIRMIWIGMEMLNDGISSNEIWKNIRINPKYLKGISIDELKKLFSKLQYVDTSLKSSSISKDGLLKDLIIGIHL